MLRVAYCVLLLLLLPLLQLPLQLRLLLGSDARLQFPRRVNVSRLVGTDMVPKQIEEVEQDHIRRIVSASSKHAVQLKSENEQPVRLGAIDFVSSMGLTGLPRAPL